MGTDPRLRWMTPEYAVRNPGAWESPCRITQDSTDTVRLKPAGNAACTKSVSGRIPPSYMAKLLDLGPHGIGVKVTQQAASRLLAFVHCRCELRPPFSAQPVQAAVRVNHGRPMPDGDYYVGFVFESPPKSGSI